MTVVNRSAAIHQIAVPGVINTAAVDRSKLAKTFAGWHQIFENHQQVKEQYFLLLTFTTNMTISENILHLLKVWYKL